MINERNIDLINRELDRELERGELASLQALLAADPEAHAYREQLASLCDALGNIPAIEPPDGLRDAILAQLPESIQQAAPIRTPEPARISWLQILESNWLRPAFSMAAVLLVAVVLLQLDTSTLEREEVDQAIGAMVAPESGGESFIIDHPGLLATVHLQTRRDDLLLEFTVESDTTTATVIQVPGQHYQLLPFDAGINTADSVEMKEDTLSLSSSGSTMVWALLRRRGDSQPASGDVIKLQFTQNGRVVHDASLPIPAY